MSEATLDCLDNQLVFDPIPLKGVALLPQAKLAHLYVDIVLFQWPL